MLPLVGIAKTVEEYLKEYRKVFKKKAGYEHIKRYVNGLLLSENKTLEGIYKQIVWESSEEKVSRRAMHEAVFENGWSYQELMKIQREKVGRSHQGKGKEVISLDWTLGHHKYSQKISVVKGMYDYVERCWSRYQTIMTAVVANGEKIDGLVIDMQMPSYKREEKAYLEMSKKEDYDSLQEARTRIMELLHYQKNCLEYRKRTEIAVEMVRQIEQEGILPNANYAFDQGILSRELTQVIEESGKYWVTEVEKSRNVMWQNQWQRVDKVAAELKDNYPESFRLKQVTCRNGKKKDIWTFTKVVRLKKYGRQRLTIVHEQEDLEDKPRFLLTNALHWDSARTFSTWTYRWAIEVFHEFSKQMVGLESAQLRNQEAVKRHFCLSCLAQSILQSAVSFQGKSERIKGTEFTHPAIGHSLQVLARQALSNLLSLAHHLFAQGQSIPDVLEVLMPIF